jgi:hypothetical protein
MSALRPPPAIRINILGPLDIKGVLGAPKLPPGARNIRVMLALMAFKQSYEFEEFVNIVWGDPDVVDSEGRPIPTARRNVDTLAKKTRVHLGDAKKQLRVQAGRVSLFRTSDGSTVPSLTTDADDFMRLKSSHTPDGWRDAVRLVRGEIAEDVPANSHQEVWLVSRRSEQRNQLSKLLSDLFPRHTDVDSLVDEVLTYGGATVVDRPVGITVPAEKAKVPPRPFGEIDWESLGITPAAIGTDVLPQCLERTIDPLIDERLQRALELSREPIATDHRDRFVLVEGPSMSGKTRALYEAVHRDEALRIIPTLAPASDDPAEVAHCIAVAQSTQTPLLLWLDDIDGHCSYQSQTQGVTVARLRTALLDNTSLIVLATAGGKGAVRALPETSERGQIWRDILTLTTVPLELDGGVSFAEVQQARKAGWPELVVAAIERHGLGSALSAGPDLVQRLKAARNAHSDARYGWALAAAVGLLESMWFAGPVPEHTARSAWRGLLAQHLNGLGEEQAWNAALKFSFHVIGRDTKLLYEGRRGLTLHDYVRPRVALTGAEIRRTLEGASSGMNGQECRVVMSNTFSDEIAKIAPALHLAREGDKSALLTICEWLTSYTDWPTDTHMIEASTRLACCLLDCLLRQADGGSETVFNIIHHIGGLPDPVFDGVCERVEAAEIMHADLAISAIRIMRLEPNTDDGERVITAGLQSQDARSRLAIRFLDVLRYRAMLETPTQLEDLLEAPDYLGMAIYEVGRADSPADLARIEVLLTDAINQVGIETVADELAKCLAMPSMTTNALREIDLVLPIFDRVIGRSPSGPIPKIAYSRAMLALMYDSLDYDAENILLTFVDHPDHDMSRGSTLQLLEAYHQRRDENAIYALLDQLPKPFVSNMRHWTKPLRPRQRTWLLERAKHGDCYPAALICRLSDDHIADAEAFSIVEQIAAQATFGEMANLANLLCGKFYTDLFGDAGAEARRIGLDLLRECCRYPLSVQAPFSPRTMLMELLADDPDGADEMSDLLYSAIQSGDSSGVTGIHRFQSTLGKDRVQWLLDQWKALTDEAFIPVWEWARSLPWPNENAQTKVVTK